MKLMDRIYCMVMAYMMARVMVTIGMMMNAGCNNDQ